MLRVAAPTAAEVVALPVAVAARATRSLSILRRYLRPARAQAKVATVATAVLATLRARVLLAQLAPLALQVYSVGAAVLEAVLEAAALALQSVVRAVLAVLLALAVLGESSCTWWQHEAIQRNDSRASP